MGVKISGDVAQHIMTKMLEGLDCECYIDDVGIWTNGDFYEHVDLVDQVLKQFADNAMQCNPLKSEWMVKEIDFLGHWMTPEGIRPWKHKIGAVLLMDRPQCITEHTILDRSSELLQILLAQTRPYIDPAHRAHWQ